MPIDKEMPDWAKKIENWGDHFWDKKDLSSKKEKEPKRSAYVAAIVVNVILVFVFNNLLNWHIPWLTSEFIIPLWVFNVSFGATILFNIIFLIYNEKWLRTLSQLLLNVISLAVISTLYEIFPFSLSTTHEGWARIALIVMLIGILIAIIVEFIKLISYIIRFVFKNL